MIDLKKLEKEQIKLSKLVEEKDYIDFSLVRYVGGVGEVIDEKNKKILACIVVIDADSLKEVEVKWHSDKLKFPYIPGFRAYRELHALIYCYEKLENLPEVIFIKAHGTAHPRGLGLASHFGILTNSCVVGICDEVMEGLKVEGEYVKRDGRVVGKFVKVVEYANPVVVSVGNKISLDSAIELVKRFSLGKYKFTYPITLATKQARKIARSLKD
jgi:deoxyribonuclease V